MFQIEILGHLIEAAQEMVLFLDSHKPTWKNDCGKINLHSKFSVWRT